jgi:hypothetical protein
MSSVWNNTWDIHPYYYDEERWTDKGIHCFVIEL